MTMTAKKKIEPDEISGKLKIIGFNLSDVGTSELSTLKLYTDLSKDDKQVKKLIETVSMINDRAVSVQAYDWLDSCIVEITNVWVDSLENDDNNYSVTATITNTDKEFEIDIMVPISSKKSGAFTYVLYLR